VKRVEPVQPNFGIRIKLLRRNAGLTQQQLAELCELSVDQISSIERGKSFAGRSTLPLLASTLGVPKEALFNNSQNEAFIKDGGMDWRAARTRSPLIVRKGRVEMKIKELRSSPKDS
jgi:transcriptional regulator with XRE-family HTH domain